MSFLAVMRRRLLLLGLVVFGVSAVIFAVSHLIPGDPARLMAGQRAPEEVVEAMRHQLSLDRPLHVQYVRFAAGLLEGDLGTSIRTRRPVAEDLAAFFPATLELVLVALLFAVAVGIPLGVVSAARRDRWPDHLARLFSVAGISTPAFWLALVLILVFYGRLGILPGTGRLDGALVPPDGPSGLYLLDAALAGDWVVFRSAAAHLVLPAFTLGFVHVGVVARQIRASMLEVLGEDYVRTARSCGLSRRSVLLGHALRNALIPSVTLIGLAFGDLLYGAVLTETIFAWPGMGGYVVDSIATLDFPAIMGFTVVASAAYVAVNLLVDLAYMALDPRIREVG